MTCVPWSPARPPKRDRSIRPTVGKSHTWPATIPAACLLLSLTVQVTGNDDGTYRVTINGAHHDYAAVGKTITEIRDGVVAAIQAGSEPVDVTPSGTDSLVIDADLVVTPGCR